MSSSEVPGRILAIDFGTKRIGLALSDELGLSAAPLEVWERRTQEEDLSHLQDLVRVHEVAAVLVGIPFHLDGSAGPSAERAQRFLAALEAHLAGVPVLSQDEALTTWEAEERMKARGLGPAERKASVDAYAALVMLDQYLTERRGRTEPELLPPGKPPRRGRRR